MRGGLSECQRPGPPYLSAPAHAADLRTPEMVAANGILPAVTHGRFSSHTRARALTHNSVPGSHAGTTPREPLTSLSALDAAKSQDVLLVREELLHLVKGLLAANGQFIPWLGPGQNLAHGPLRQSQDIMSENALSDIVLDQLFLHLPGDFRSVYLLALGDAPSTF